MRWSHWHKKLPAYYGILFAILTVGTAIRLYGLNYDLPFIYDQDEPIFVVRALSILKNHDLNPHWFGAPASTTIYLLSGLYAIIFLVGRAIGIFQSAEDFRNLYYSNPTVFYLSGRIVSLLFGVASIWLVYKIGRRLFGLAAGLIAAAILALSPTHIFLSQQVRMDVQMAFLVLVAFWFCLNILEKQDWRSYLLAGFVTGLAIVTKYPAAVFTLMILLSHFSTTTTWLPTQHRKLLASAAACLTGMFAGSPFVFLDFRTVLKDVIQEARPEHLSATGDGLLLNILWYLQGPLPTAVSLAGLVLAGVGIILCLTSKKKSCWVLISFPLIFLLFVSSLNLRWERWILPLVPFLGLLLAVAITQLAKLLAERLNRRVAVAATVALLLVVFGPLLIDSFVHARGIAGPYTSTLAREWMLTHVPAGSSVLVEVLGPPLPTEAFKVFVIEQDGTVVPAKYVSAGSYQAGWDIGSIKNLADLPALGIQYFVMTGFYQHFVNERGKYPGQVANYEKLMSSSSLIYEVEASRGRSRGPRVRIYQLN